MDWPQFIREFGLPLAMLVGLIFAVLKGWVYFKPHVEALLAQLALMTALYERERGDRIAAQELVAGFASANADVAEAVASLSQAVVSDERPHPREARKVPKRDPYAERLEGRRDG